MTTPSLRAFDQLAANRRAQRGTPVPQLPLDQIGPLPGQPRQTFDPEALAELAESIKAHGVIQPIIVIARKDVSESDPVRYRIVCGERRFQAARLAGLSAIPALVRDYEDDEVAVLALLENLQREDLTPLEEGEYLLQLKQKYGFTEEQLGERLGKSRDYVHNRTRLLSLNPDLLEAWRTAPSANKLTASHAIWINQLATPEGRKALLDAVMEEQFTVAEVRRRLEKVKGVEARRAELPPEEFAVALEAAALGSKPKLEKAPAGEPLTGVKLALEDLAVYQLIAGLMGAGEKDVELQALQAALKKDAGWVRKLQRDVIAKG